MQNVGFLMTRLNYVYDCGNDGGLGFGAHMISVFVHEVIILDFTSIFLQCVSISIAPAMRFQQISTTYDFVENFL